jgi:hypothetical protein
MPLTSDDRLAMLAVENTDTGFDANVYQFIPDTHFSDSLDLAIPPSAVI